MSARLILFSSLAAFVALCTPTSSAADPPSTDQATARAKIHNDHAKQLFNLGLFREAADEYQKAYQAKQVPAFLFNLAQCYKRMTQVDQLQKAIFYYRSFLNNDPFSPMRQNIEEEIAKLEKQIEELRRPPPTPFYRRWWFWGAVGLAVTGAAIGTAVALRPQDAPVVTGKAPPGTFEIP